MERMSFCALQRDAESDCVTLRLLKQKDKDLLPNLILLKSLCLINLVVCYYLRQESHVEE